MLRKLIVAALTALAVLAPAQAKEGWTSDRIAVTVEGKGKDVILVPGLTSSPSAWRESAKAMPGYRYHFVQVKGFAGTPAEGNKQGKVVAPAADELARYIRDAKLKQPAVIGHSMGGSIGMMLAARHPGAVSKLMVVDMLPFMGAMYGPPGTTAESVKPVADAIVAGMRSAPPAEGDKRLVAMTTSMVNSETQRPLVLADARASDTAVVANAFHELIVTDLGPELPKITAPTTVLYVTPKGAPLTDAQIDGYYKAAYAPLAGARLVRVPDSAHFIMSDNPAFFQDQVKTFLN